MASFSCDGCCEIIPPHKARIHCEECPDYDTCTNCYVLGIFTNSHTSSHRTVLKEKSGNVPTFSPPPPPPPRQNVPNTAPQQHTQMLPRGNIGLGVPDMQGWRLLFDGSRPTQFMVDFFGVIFSCLDTARSGYLTPEQYSAFCDVQGYDLDANVCKSHLPPPATASYHPVPPRKNKI
jgi:hypothetical protein